MKKILFSIIFVLAFFFITPQTFAATPFSVNDIEGTSISWSLPDNLPLPGNCNVESDLKMRDANSNSAVRTIAICNTTTGTLDVNIDGLYTGLFYIELTIDGEDYRSQNFTVSETEGFQGPNGLITPTPTPGFEVKIVSDPTSGSQTVGSQFMVDVKVNAASDSAFNAARANVAVSSNLSITGLHAPSSNACNLSYTQTPTNSNPSFAGAIFGGSSEGCTVYTMTLTPTDEGTGTVTFTNGSVKSYEDNSEILDGVTNASFTLGDGPTPTAMLEFAVTSPLQTYKTNYDLAGTKLSSITSIFVNGDEEDSTYPTSTTWSVPITLNLGENNFTVYGSDGSNQTATQNVIVDRHTLGDINGDGEVNLIDASLFAVDWDKTEDLTYLLSDMNDDGEVDLTDLSILAKLQ